MRKRGIVFILLAAVIAIAVNTFTYRSVLNGSNTILNLVKKFNFAYAAPRTYVNLFKGLARKPDYSDVKQLDMIISDKSADFIEAAFKGDSKTIEQMLDSNTKYIRSKDESSFIRYIGNETHIEGYMATDKKLIKAKQRWYVVEEDNTVTCCMEVYIENIKSPQLWYLHFKKVKNAWKILMLENDV